MLTIRFADTEGLEKGIGIFRRYGESIPIGDADTYLVSDTIATLLKEAGISFEEVKNGQAHLTKDVFADIRESLDELHAGNVTFVEDPQSLDDIIAAGKDG